MPMRLQRFQGVVPRTTGRQIGDLQAQKLFNFRLTSNRLDPLYHPKLLPVITNGDVQSIYRLYDSAGVGYWLNWLEDVDVVRGPVAGDESFRFYFTSKDFEPRQSNLAMATATAEPYPNQWYVNGVTPPIAAPTPVHSAGSGAVENRVYCSTLVTEWGEESAPSPVSAVVVGTAGGTWTVGVSNVAPLNAYAITAASWAAGELSLTASDSLFGLRVGERLALTLFSPDALNASFRVASIVGAVIKVPMAADPGTITDAVGVATREAPHHTASMVKRLYRSVTGSSGIANFFLVANADGTAYEVAAATTSMVDDSTKGIGEPIPTDGWDMPPVDLQGIKSLPGGSLVGFAGNEVCFSEPASPYAWPVRYRMTCTYPVVGVGVYGTSVVVCTEGTPDLITGTDPETMSKTKIDQQWPCLSKRSIVDVGYGVVWSCPLGLAQIGVGGAQLLTQAFYTEKEWTELNPASLVSAYYGGRYYGSYVVDERRYGVVILDGQTADAVVTFSDLLIGSLWTDPKTGIMYGVMKGEIAQWDADQTYRLTGEWLSKEFVIPDPKNFGAARVEGTFFPTEAEEVAYAVGVAAQHVLNNLIVNDTINGVGSLNGASPNDFGLNDSDIIPDALVGDGGVRAITFELWTGGQLFASKSVNKDQTFRLPARKAYDVFSIRILSNVAVDAVLIGETAESLKVI